MYIVSYAKHTHTNTRRNTCHTRYIQSNACGGAAQHKLKAAAHFVNISQSAAERYKHTHASIHSRHKHHSAVSCVVVLMPNYGEAEYGRVRKAKAFSIEKERML